MESPYRPGGRPGPSGAPAGFGPQPGYAALRDPNPHFGYPVDRGAQVREWLDVLARGRWLVLGALLAVAVPAALYAWSLPDRYRAATVVMVQTESAGSIADILPTSGGGLTGQRRQIENEVLQLRQSDLLTERTAQALLDRARGSETGPLTILEPHADGTPATVATVAARLRSQYLSVTAAGRDLDAINVTATSTDPAEAALLANLYAQAYLDRTREGSRASVTASRAFLEAQVDSLAGELAAREEAVRQYMTREGAVRLDAEADRLVSQIASLQAERDAARVGSQMRGASATQLQRELAQIEPRLAQRLAANTDVEIAQTQERILGLQTRLETFYARNPTLRESASPPAEVAATLREIETLRTRAGDLSDRFVEDAIATGGVNPTADGLARVSDLRRRLVDEQIERGGLDAQAGTVSGRIAQYESELSRIPSQAVELARLQRDRQSTERLQVALQERLQETRVAEQSELGYAEVVRRAEAPGAPFEPNRLRLGLLGILAGLGLGIGLAFVRTRMDHRIHRPDQLRDRGITVLGTTPDLTDLIREESKGAETVDVGGRAVSTSLVALVHPFAQAAEAYRALRTSVQFSRPDVVVQTLVVTSASPGEGKSTTAANLALTMAQAGRRVLLVDADLRRPRVHALFGLSRTPGVADLLFMQTDGTALPDNFPTSGVDNLDVLSAGRVVANPSELLGSRAMRDLHEAWRQYYDVIVFDVPPVLAATDAVLLSTQADGVIVVARAEKTKDFELDRALDTLASVGAPVLGVVVNAFDASQSYGYRYRYTTGYGSRYGYGYSEMPADARPTASAPL